MNKTLSKNYLTARLFLDDLKSIEELIGNNQSYKIEAGDYEFKDVEELKNKHSNQKLNNVKISAHNPYITIEFHKMWVKLYCGSDDTGSAGLFYKLDSIISSSSRRFSFIYSYYSIWIVNIAIFLIPKSSLIYSNKLIFNSLTPIFVLWIAWVSYIRLLCSGEVILSGKGDVKNFFERNRDQIIVGIITGIVVAIIMVYFPQLQSLVRSFLS